MAAAMEIAAKCVLSDCLPRAASASYETSAGIAVGRRVDIAHLKQSTTLSHAGLGGIREKSASHYISLMWGLI
jgi:hypothetical protein